MSLRQGHRVLQTSWTRSSWGCRLQAGFGSGSGPSRTRSAAGTMNVFNREMKRRQKNWAAALQDHHLYDYLRDQVTTRDPLTSETQVLDPGVRPGSRSSSGLLFFRSAVRSLTGFMTSRGGFKFYLFIIITVVFVVVVV